MKKCLCLNNLNQKYILALYTEVTWRMSESVLNILIIYQAKICRPTKSF